MLASFIFVVIEFSCIKVGVAMFDLMFKVYNFLAELTPEQQEEWNKQYSGGGEVLNPIYNGLSLIGPYALGVVLCLAMIYGIFLGVKYAQAEDEATKANAQKTLINFIIGAITVWILLAVLYAIRGPLGRWITE